MSQERRSDSRRDCFKVARVVIGNHIVEGTLRDVSMTGGRLHLPNAPFYAPDNFDLYLDGDASCYSVRVVWRYGPHFGVTFNTARSIN
jgi:hypothetical protein